MSTSAVADAVELGGDGSAQDRGLAVVVAVERGARAAGFAGDVVDGGLAEAEAPDADQGRIADPQIGGRATVKVIGLRRYTGICLIGSAVHRQAGEHPAEQLAPHQAAHLGRIGEVVAAGRGDERQRQPGHVLRHRGEVGVGRDPPGVAVALEQRQEVRGDGADRPGPAAP